MINDDVIKKIGSYWDDYSEKFDEEHDTENIDVWKDYLASILGEDKNKSVIDIGTGTGFLANMISDIGYGSIGVDIAEKMMALGVKHAKDKNLNTVFMYGNALKLPFMDNTADFIVNCRLIWTLVEPDEAIKEWARIIKPGGSIFCFNSMKENVGMTKWKDNYYNDNEVEKSLVIASAGMDELKDLMERNGLVNVRINKLPETSKSKEILEKDWYQPWFVLAADKPL